jgi:hypothetical protein
MLIMISPCVYRFYSELLPGNTEEHVPCELTLDLQCSLENHQAMAQSNHCLQGNLH